MCTRVGWMRRNVRGSEDETVPDDDPTLDIYAVYKRMVEHLTEALSDSETCPQEVTTEGCQRPDDNTPERWPNSGWCVKHERMGKWGQGCWRLWAQRKAMSD